MKRIQFIRNGLLVTGLGLALPSAFARSASDEKFTAEEIREFVFAAHKDFDEVKRIITEKPLLLNCANQSRRGDFETAMGGAAHMGRRDIADLLLERGARLDIFSMTFLGHTDLVKQMIQVSPHLLNAPGPHGFTLLHHAYAGKQEDFASWLQDQGLTETHFKGIFREW